MNSKLCSRSCHVVCFLCSAFSYMFPCSSSFSCFFSRFFSHFFSRSPFSHPPIFSTLTPFLLFQCSMSKHGFGQFPTSVCHVSSYSMLPPHGPPCCTMCSMSTSLLALVMCGPVACLQCSWSFLFSFMCFQQQLLLILYHPQLSSN